MKQRSRNTRDMLIGEWRNVYLKVDMNSYKNGENNRTVEVDETNWEQKLKSKVIRTFFRADGTYNSEHRNLKDSIFYNPAGTWRIKGDSLYLTDTFPKAISYRFKVAIKDNIAEVTGLLDFDENGKEDDLYYDKQRKQ